MKNKGYYLEDLFNRSEDLFSLFSLNNKSLTASLTSKVRPLRLVSKDP